MAILFQWFIVDLIVGLTTLLAVFYWYLNKNFDYWKKRNIPFVKPSAFFGNFKSFVFFRKSIADVYLDIYSELKDYKIGGIWFFSKPFLVIKDPEIIKRILVKDFSHFHDRGVPVDENKDPLSPTLFNLSSSKWRALRVKLSPTFTTGKMKMMFSLMHECALEFVELVDKEARDSKEVEFRDLFAKLTTDIIGSCAFGMQFNSMKNPDSEFRRMGHKFFNPSFLQIIATGVYYFFPRLADALNVKFPPQDISDFFMNAVLDTVAYREKNNVKRNDFLQLLMELKHKGRIETDEYDAILSVKGLASENDMKNFELTDSLLAAQTFLFFTAGFETSSTTMSFALHELVVNPDIKDKLRDEIDRVLDEHGGELTYESVKKMDYLEKVIYEALRKYPVIPTLMRKCTKTYLEPDTNTLIEEGTSVEIPVYALHHDPQYYPNPELFDPERFSEEEKSKRPHYVYLPFGEGPRICIGMRFAIMQAKLGLAALLARFDLNVCDRTPQPLVLDPKTFLPSAKGGVWARVTPRQQVSLKSSSRRDKDA